MTVKERSTPRLVGAKNAEVSEERWRRAVIPSHATVQDAIRSLDQSGMQIVLVVSDGDTLQGTVTDGDVRRGLLRGSDLASPIREIVFENPLVVPAEFGRDAALQIMKANRIHQLPIVDESRRVIGLHLLDELIDPGNRDNLMIVMAGGQGSRLRPHTESCPKPMLAVGSKPMLEHIIERAKADGFRRFVISIHYLGEVIRDYFGDGAKWKVDVQYIEEAQPLGTAGGIALLDPRPNQPFVVTNGDVLTDIHYAEILDFHARHNVMATMAVRVHEWKHPFGVVHTSGVDIVGFEEKPVARSHINAGIYVLQPEAMDALAPGEHCDMPMLFTRLKERGGRTIIYPMHEPWLDVGRAAELEQARAEIGRTRE